MADMLIVGGEKANLLEQIPAAHLTVSDADIKFPSTGLVGGIPSEFFRFLTAGADRAFTGNLDIVSYGTMEVADGTKPAGWVDAGHVDTPIARTTTGGEFKGGAAGMKLVSASAKVCKAYRDIEVRAGQRMNVAAWLRGDGTRACKVQIQNRHTGKWLKSDKTWQATAQDTLSRTTNDFAAQSSVTAWNVESYAACGQQSKVTLRVFVVNDYSGAATVFCDDLVVFPAWNLVFVEGALNLDASISCEIHSSTDSYQAPFSSNDVTETTVAAPLLKPNFYVSYGATWKDLQHVRVILKGTNSVGGAPICGQLVVAQALTAARMPGYPVTTEEIYPQLRPSRDRAYAMTDWPERMVNLPFVYLTLAQFQEARNEIMRRGRGGVYPMLLIPLDSDPETAIYGRVNNMLHYEQTTPTLREAVEIIIEESAHPTLIA